MFSLKPFKNAFGLDFSDLKLRLVQLKKSGQKVRLHCFGEIAVPAEVMIEGEVKNEKALVDLIKKLMHSTIGGKVLSPYVIASLPERKTFVKVIETQKLPAEEMAGAIKWEAQQHIPMVIDDVYLDWQVMGSRNEKEAKKVNVLVGASPKSISDSYVNILKAAGLVPLVLETESAAIVRSIIEEKSTDQSALIIIDMGASRTGLLIYDRQVLQFTTTLNVSGWQMTNQIAKRLNLSTDQAEKAKIICGLDEKKGKGVIKNILDPLINQLIERVLETINFYKTHNTQGHDIKKILLCGGVSQTKGLNNIINKKLNLPVTMANPWVNIHKIKNKSILSPVKYLSYTTAIGLALRAFHPESFILK